MNTYETLRSKVYSIIYPDGVPLEFGVEVQNNWAGTHEPYIFIKKVGKRSFFWSKQFKEEIALDDRRSNEDREPYTILGKPLELQSILRAIKKGTYRNIKGVKIRHTKLGEVKTWKEDVLYVVDLVGLSKPIQEQDEETLSALLEILS